MSGQDTSTTPIETAVDDVLRDLERARAAEDFRAGQVGLMRAAFLRAGVLAYHEGIAQIARNGFEVIANGVPGETATAALTDAVDEGKRLLGLLGLDVDALAVPADPAGGV